MSKIPMAVFIDRDGTIGGSSEIEYPGDFKLFTFSTESIELLKQEGIKVFAFTNQPGISRGEASEEVFTKELTSFGFHDAYICPHQHGDGCSCRKPAIGMLRQASEDHELNLHKCVVIGDRWTDMVAAHQAGCRKILVQTGEGVDAMVRYRNKWAHIEPDYVAKNLKDAVLWIVNS